MFRWVRDLVDAWREFMGYDDESPAQRKLPSTVEKLMPKLEGIAEAMNGIDGRLPVERQHELELCVRRIRVFRNKALNRADFVRSDQTLVAHVAEGKKKDGSRGMVVSFPLPPSVTDRALFESTPWLNAEIRPGS